MTETHAPIPTGATDVHQHLWPEELVDRLRARSRAPHLRGWTLHTDGEPPYDVDPAGHDVATRVAADREAGVVTACLSLSSPLGIEGLLRPEAQPLLDAWHRGVRDLPDHFKAWVSVPDEDPDIASVRRLLAEDRFVGLQLPATELSTPAAWERAAALLLAAELSGKPVFVHPGPEPRRVLAGRLPEWWAPVVGYTAQLQAAWWGWHALDGRRLFPRLRLVFGAGAGLAPAHVERHALRGGGRTTVDPLVFVDTSCTGTRALEAVVRVLGIDALVHGSDRPYGEPLTQFLGDAATHAVRVANPARLLGDAGTREQGGDQAWAVAS
jgi:predicted TIM-barrel fold metal-dependent hydrolase